MATPAQFVWLRGLRGPEPQLWTKPLVGVDKGQIDRVVFSIDIEDRDTVTLDQCIAAYPAPTSTDIIVS